MTEEHVSVKQVEPVQGHLREYSCTASCGSGLVLHAVVVTQLRRTFGRRPSELPQAIDSNSTLATKFSLVSRLNRRAMGVVVSWHR